MPDKINEVFDFLFIGMGAANCLLLLKMNEKNLLVDKKIAIVEPNSKLINDRNFCFWSSEEELHRLKLHEFIDSKWHKIKVADRVCQTLAPLSYYHIRGLTLYKKVREILPNLNVKQFFENFEDEPVIESNLFILNFKDSIIKCEKVFDSRPPSYESAKKYQSLIFQSFYGWEIKTDAYNFDTETAIMMDFNIPQNYHCQFIYVLPFSKNTALFEVTRFGKEKISKTEAEKLLKDYLQNLGFQYQIYEEEVGVIPMSTLKISETNYGENWILTGAKANMIKPTTGYAFYNMSVDAIEICDALFINKVHQRKKQKLRFNFYDNLLLKILEKKPQMGKRVFEKLFNKTPIFDVLQFLSEKTTLKKEFLIFSRLPIFLFLSGAIRYFFLRITNLPPTILGFLLTLIFLALQNFKSSETEWALLGIGFISVGLPHGALDHLTSRNIKSFLQYLTFMSSYLAKAAILGVLWLLFPDAALMAFIAFSAWHFGQADIREWKLNQGINSFLWGLLVLSNLLIYHLNETVLVLHEIKNLQILDSLNLNTNYQMYWVEMLLFAVSLLFAAINKSIWMFLTVFYLFLSSLLPLNVSFGIYFIAQHSLHGWKHLKKELSLSSLQLWLRSIPFSLGGILIFIIFFSIFKGDYTGLFFIILSCISMPHVISIHNFYHRLKP